MNAKVFHQRARDCRKLAAECADLYAREALIELAAEFERIAKDLDARARRVRNERARRHDHAGAGTPSHRQPSPR